MRNYVALDPWKIVQNNHCPEDNLFYESLMSLGNGRLGLRGNFEEKYSGESLTGTYVAGIYFPDKTKVGWWKNGYPEYFQKVLNSANLIGVDIEIDSEHLDLNIDKPIRFNRTLNMRSGILTRSFEVKKSGCHLKIEVERFVHMVRKESLLLRYCVTALSGNPTITISSFIDGDVHNQDSNYKEYFWTPINQSASKDFCHMTLETKKTGFSVVSSQSCKFKCNAQIIDDLSVINKAKLLGQKATCSLKENDTFSVSKFVTVTNSRYYDKEQLVDKARKLNDDIHELGYDSLRFEHIESWREIWNHSDIRIDGDEAAQQGIRFNIFHLKQTYTGDDSRLNIGPKGFTGEKYGGSTYWDTESFCLPFYLGTSNEDAAKNLLLYRYNHLEKAKENAKTLGLKGALYPMVTMNGEESHNEWEITFEEIHRNSAIAYAIYNYTNYTGSKSYLFAEGIEVLLEISRFWMSRVNYVAKKDKFMILGVTGPNEYENNVNNNWYTNRIASWCIEYTLSTLSDYKKFNNGKYDDFVNKHNVTIDEIKSFKEVVEKMHYPEDKELGIFLQQDGYLDKEQILVEDLDPSHLPLNQNWSWDRILRSCFIKQADVLQGLFFLSEYYTIEEKRRNFDFYEPRTVHESSLSPCVYSIIASEIGYKKKAYELYKRSARLDLDNINHDTDDGLHITSMAGTWMSIVYGFSRFKVIGDTIHLSPFLPNGWKSYSFRIMFREHLLEIIVDAKGTSIKLIKGESLKVFIYGKQQMLAFDSVIFFPHHA
ncbi:MAG TPA: family 65 glycosyl hydrolase domain-containing protein [Clostridia bacterium]|nr:family 65 glycosyl hydrolase domain-containing protein [Clostridia bacterium]